MTPRSLVCRVQLSSNRYRLPPSHCADGQTQDSSGRSSAPTRFPVNSAATPAEGLALREAIKDAILGGGACAIGMANTGHP
jgi:hypothetical protein